MNSNPLDVTLSDRDFSKLRAIVHQCTGITIGETRKSMLVSRLRGRLRELNAPNFSSYINQLSNDPCEVQELTNRVTTNKTYFYRTPRVWDYFLDVFVPEFLESGQNSPMRVWSAAASTGEEAYTVGVMLEEQRTLHARFDYSVVGTDVSSRVLEVAQKGVYSGQTIVEFRKEKAESFQKHMLGNDETGYQVSAVVKSRIKFKLHNLLDTLKGTTPFDAVFLRNVLIYFTNEDQEQILQNVRDLIKPDGVLFIGESETLSSLKTDFELAAPFVYRPAARVNRSCV